METLRILSFPFWGYETRRETELVNGSDPKAAMLLLRAISEICEQVQVLFYRKG